MSICPAHKVVCGRRHTWCRLERRGPLSSRIPTVPLSYFPNQSSLDQNWCAALWMQGSFYIHKDPISVDLGVIYGPSSPPKSQKTEGGERQHHTATLLHTELLNCRRDHQPYLCHLTLGDCLSPREDPYTRLTSQNDFICIWAHRVPRCTSHFSYQHGGGC